MKLNVFQNDNPIHVELTQHDKSVVAVVDGRRYELNVRVLANGGLLLMDGPRVYECFVQSAEGHDIFAVHLQGIRHEFRIQDPKRLRSGEAAGSHNHGSAKISAAMPGKVVRVLVEVGQTVEAGAGVLVVEAMKMQNEMKSPKTGTIVSLQAEVGATVNAGDVLAVIE